MLFGLAVLTVFGGVEAALILTIRVSCIILVPGVVSQYGPSICLKGHPSQAQSCVTGGFADECDGIQLFIAHDALI